MQQALRRLDVGTSQESTAHINLYDGVTGAMKEIHVSKAADVVRERTGAVKRVPPSVRVWFARLQMPVLRLALSDPTFFGALAPPGPPADRSHGVVRDGL